MKNIQVLLISILGGIVATRLPLDNWIYLYLWGGLMGISICFVRNYEN